MLIRDRDLKWFGPAEASVVTVGQVGDKKWQLVVLGGEG